MDARYALSRNEEENLLKSMKADSLRACEIPVQAFADCGAGRTVTVVWSCRHQFKAMKACMATQMTESRIEDAKREFLKERSTAPVPTAST